MRAYCPRNQTIRVERCQNTDCPYYSSKLSYNCIQIHKDIFFKDYEEVPLEVVEIGLGLTSTEFKLLEEQALFTIRMKIVRAKFDTMDYCEHCGAICPEPCDCELFVKTRVLRERLNYKWTQWEPSDEFIRGLKHLVDGIPFGFVFTYFVNTYSIPHWVIARNLGITAKAYDLAHKAFIGD